MQILDHEQFEGAKELAEIGKKIAEGRAVLEELKRTEPEYLDEREEKARARISKVLDESKDLISAIGKNHDALVKYRRDLDSYVETIRYFVECVNKWKAAFDDDAGRKSDDIERQSVALRTLIEEERRQFTILAAKNEEIDNKRALLKKEADKIADEWHTLNTTAKEIKSKQQKI